MDAWQAPTWADYTIQNVHLQGTNEVRKTTTNTEVVLRSILFVDGVRSTPHLDLDALAERSQAAGRPMRATVCDARGRQVGEYEVLTVDSVPDVPSNRIHHWELGLV
ncbi:MAG: hypothetical protein DBX91_14080 [Subdoligranulum variabile]|nr:MAG: hypothetical protein DBX91_14080 [Subdoligranulum variabile]